MLEGSNYGQNIEQYKEISSSRNREQVPGLHKVLKIRLIEKNTFEKNT